MMCVLCVLQAVACSLYVVGFGESLTALLHQDSVWMARGIGAGIVLLLLGLSSQSILSSYRLSLLVSATVWYALNV